VLVALLAKAGLKSRLYVKAVQAGLKSRLYVRAVQAGLRSRLYVLVCVAATAWIALLVVTPLLPVPLGAAMYAVGAFICHQRPERSFHLDSIQLPVCARCLGIYCGAALGMALRLGPRWRPALSPRLLMVAGAAPTLGMVALETAGLWHTSNAARAAAGIWLGVSVAVAVLPSPIANRRQADSPDAVH
jgi:uncharacterized membrane protein